MLKGIDFLRGGVALTLGALALTGCGGGDGASATEDLPPAAQPMSTEVQGLVDQGNAAQRGGLYAEALEHYQAAMELAPEHPIPQFGALMAATTLGDTALAASLSEQLQATAPELLGMLTPGGSMGGGMPADPHGGMSGSAPTMPPGADAGMGGLPPAHPVLIDASADTLQPDTTVSH